jgi:ABC-type uncharacterized transport system permease subunit
MNAAIIIGVVASSIMSGTSLLYATLGEIVGERSGVVNLGLEGIMLIGASTGFAATAVTGNPYLGIAAAAFSGAAVNMIFAYLVVGRGANQLATGLTLMFFCFGLSAMIGRPFVGTLITGLPRLPLFGLGSGGAAARLLSYDLLVYLVFRNFPMNHFSPGQTRQFGLSHSDVAGRSHQPNPSDDGTMSNMVAAANSHFRGAFRQIAPSSNQPPRQRCRSRRSRD